MGVYLTVKQVHVTSCRCNSSHAPRKRLDTFLITAPRKLTVNQDLLITVQDNSIHKLHILLQSRFLNLLSAIGKLKYYSIGMDFIFNLISNFKIKHNIENN